MLLGFCYPAVPASQKLLVTSLYGGPLSMLAEGVFSSASFLLYAALSACQKVLVAQGHSELTEGKHPTLLPFKCPSVMTNSAAAVMHVWWTAA